LENRNLLKPEKIGKLGQLYVGDCIALMKEMPDHTVSGIVADPPYG